MSLLEQVRKECLRRGLSPKTIKTYYFCVDKFLRTCRKDFRHITKQDVQEYLDRFIENQQPGNTINVHVNALKFFFEQVLKRRLTISIRYVKTRRRLPEFLTKEEIARVFVVITNQKHKLMITLLYATGMRVSELASLKVKDFEFSQNYGWVRQGKGGKDRLFIIPIKLKEELLQWISSAGLLGEQHLFSGNRAAPVSTATIRAIIKDAARKARITKNVHPHTLRHSFATHLIQDGYAVTELQPLLGHASIQTTMIYLHLASPPLLRVKSPYDTLGSVPCRA